MPRQGGSSNGPPGEDGRRDAGCGPLGHVPVLLSSVLEALGPADGEIIIDGTFGAGGYSRAILGAADCRLIALDRDPEAQSRAQELAAEFGPRFSFYPDRFGRLEAVMAQAGIKAIDALVLDVGVSSMQIDDPRRGFSFSHDGPLDMRMSQEGESAADIVNQYEEKELADILFRLGEERRARAIARAIVRERQKAPITSTARLAEIVSQTLGRRQGSKKHPATRTFQALRIKVNHELEELAAVLGQAERLLRPGGRLVVVSFHSLEDRLVKQFLFSRALPPPRPSRHLPGQPGGKEFTPSFRLINRKPITPGPDELASNPRARSARLRAAVKL